ncbi:hypothetical protein BDQ17DRAFT_1244811 [Cyathus striatus]|nr:hypothetical protein BDQ17DRAFT_1244811 [Cyathus striatus]
MVPRVTQQQVPVSSLLRKSPPSAASLRDAEATDTGAPRQPGWTPPSKRQEKVKPRTSSASTSFPKTAKSATKKNTSGSEPKRLSLACLFCRERKIACGRPAAGSLDQRCNQCVRRSFTCEYPTESRRGQHKRLRKKVPGHEVNKSK